MYGGQTADRQPTQPLDVQQVSDLPHGVSGITHTYSTHANLYTTLSVCNKHGKPLSPTAAFVSAETHDLQIWSPSGKRRPPPGRWVSTGKEALKSGLNIPGVAESYDEGGNLTSARFARGLKDGEELPPSSSSW
jgi:hypothetical protein